MRETDRAMRDTDEAIDKVLAGLRGVEPPAGMERRLMLTLERRAGEPVRGSRLGWRMGGWMLAGAMILTVGLAFVRSHRHVQPFRQALAGSSAPSGVVAPRIPLPGHQPSSQPRATKRVRTQAAVEEPRMRELGRTSFPAPPMPLTEQERLLLRIAHTGDPVELAMLDPEMRALGEEQRKREFLAYFPPPPVPTNPAPGENQ